MNRQMDLSARTHTAGAVAADGLLHGIVAGLAMALVMAAAGLTYGESPLVLLERFSPPGATSPLVGAAMHLGVSAFYGILFALLWRLVHRVSRQPMPMGLALVAGVAYGVALWLFAVSVLLPSTHAALLQVPPLTFAAGHVIYGLVMGYFARAE